MAENHTIGKDNQLLWHIPEDLKHFKNTTMGCPLIMGRKTFESLPGILPGRPHIVISRNAAHEKESNTKHTVSNEKPVFFVTSVADAIEKASDLARAAGVDKIFVTGGGEIYRQAMPLVEKIYLSVVHKDFEGDTTFPAIDGEDWRTLSETPYPATEKHPGFTVYTLQRVAEK
jgi:dihydrofolate reductase